MKKQMKSSLRRGMAVCLGFATAFGASLANANVISFGPDQGFSDSVYYFSGSLTYSGSTLTSWDLVATCPACSVPAVQPGPQHIVYEWTPANSTFTAPDPNTLVISIDGNYYMGPPSAWLNSGGSSFSEMTGTSNLGSWQFFVTWAFGGQYANGSTYFLAAPDAAPPVPEPETYVMLLTGLGVLGLVARRRKQRTALYANM